MDYIFKYNKVCFEKFLDKFNLCAQDCVIFEDSIKNLETAKACGMITVFVKPDKIEKPQYVDYMFSDIKTALKELGFEFPDSMSNFIFAKQKDIDAETIFTQLKERKIFVRYWNKPRINNYLRISIGTDSEMDKLISALKEILNYK